jgi:nicotinamide-nucleotide amidase
VEELLPLARRQALLPAGATPVPPAGVAPGIAARHGRTRVYAFPGVPFEFREMWRAVAGDLEAQGFFPDVALRVVRIYGIGEIQVAPLLDEVPHDLLETGINVGRGEVTVRLRSRRDPRAEEQAEAVVDALRSGAPVFSADGRTIDDLLADGLRAGGATLAVAESCTGGELGARLTERPGSSDYFVGGAISYADSVKAGLLGVPENLLAEHGAVSRAVAAAMAEGARRLTGATWALSLTGVAGPGGGSAARPAGLVYTACAGPRRTSVEKAHYPGDRESVRDYAVTGALHLLRKELDG